MTEQPSVQTKGAVFVGCPSKWGNPYPKLIIDESSEVEVTNSEHRAWGEGNKVGIEEVVEDLEREMRNAGIGYMLSAVCRCLEKWQTKLKGGNNVS